MTTTEAPVKYGYIVTNNTSGDSLSLTESQFLGYARKIYDENEGEDSPVPRPVEFSECYNYIREFCDNLEVVGAP